ncbi:hypothetical protein PoB_004558800 [Plakobranchus ocellatus]|uniref:Uncharacterized protein n=1 Tax=Plakobranchus ocellatus TaxID=259542 RepID=A0AAV4BIS8_9GAST|nr:hypothetical protein PoB_004558800 [Plakobranchus ocellatus]
MSVNYIASVTDLYPCVFRRLTPCLFYPCFLFLRLTSYQESGGSSGRAIGYQVRDTRFGSQSGPSQLFIAPLCPPSTKWVARSLKTHPAKVKAARKAMANYLIMLYAKNNQDPTPGSPMLGLSVGLAFTSFQDLINFGMI